MPQVKSIKIQLIFFTVLLLATSAVSVILFHRNYDQFKEDIFQKSKQNVEVIQLIEDIEAGLYHYQNALYFFLTSGDFKWKGYMDQHRKVVEENYDKLEAYSQEYFEVWVVIKDFVSEDPVAELKDVIGS